MKCSIRMRYVSPSVNRHSGAALAPGIGGRASDVATRHIVLQRGVEILRAGALVVLGILAAAWPAILHAQNNFTGPAGGDYATAGNWSGNRVPGDGNNDQMRIGFRDTHSAVYSTAASFTTTGRFLIGHDTGGDGTLTMAPGAGTLTFGGNAFASGNYVGVDRGTGTLNVYGGTLRIGDHPTSDASLLVGMNAGTATGTLHVDGGTIEIGRRLLAGANNANNVSNITLTSGTINMVRTGSNAEGDLGMLRYGNGTNTLNLDGGTFILSGIHLSGASAAKTTVNYNGTQLRANVATGSFFNTPGNAAHLVKTGGVHFDTNSHNVTFNASLADAVGHNGGLTKTGAGTMTLASASTYTGPTVVEAGTLEFSGGGRTNAAGTIAVEDGGVLRFSRNDTWGNHATDATPVITIDTGGVVESNNRFNALIGLTLNGGTLSANGGANANYPTFGLRGTVTVNPTVGGSFISTTGAGNHNTVAIGDVTAESTTTFNVADGAAAADLTVSAPLSNLTGQARGLIKTGAGTMLFTGNNTYTGTTTISDGILQVGDGGTTGTLGGGAVTNNGSLVFNRSDNATVGNVISGTGDVTQLGGGTLTLTGASTFTGNIVVNDGTLVTNVAANNANPTATGLGNMTVANRTVMVESGATLTFNASDALGSYRYKTPVTMVADGGTIQNGAGRFLAIGDIELKNGGTLNTQNGANAAYQTFNLRGSISVSGTSGSFITTTGSSLNGIHLGGSTIPATTFHVASTGDPAADLTVSVPLLNEVHTTTGGLIKAGPGTMLLTAANAYTGGTTVAAGTLHVTGSLARNGSADVRVASAGDAFGSGAPAIVRRVAPAGSFAGFGSQIDGAGTLATTADLRAGTNQGGGPLDVGMAWRTVSAAEMAAFPPRTDMLSDVLKLNGMDEAGDGWTDPFVLEMSYDPSLVQPYHDPIFLAWLDGDGEWVNAVGGNAELGGLAETEFAGSWSDFTAAIGLNSLTDLPDYLGSWGIDTAGATAWAVLNHNSQFAVLAIPEPGTWLLLLSALACGLLVRRRRAA